MAKGSRSLAKEIGATRDQVRKTKKELQKDGKPITDENVEIIKEKIRRNNKIKDQNAALVDKLSKTKKKSKVRRIDKQSGSSLEALLADAKERYVANEKIIENLQLEIDNIDCSIVDNATGSIGAIPQLGTIEKFIKLNITLRKQIAELEQAMEITGNAEEADPFA